MSKLLNNAGNTEISVLATVKGIAHQIRLATLGAVSRAQQTSGELFESLIEEGEKVEARIRSTLPSQVRVETKPMRTQSPENLENLEEIFQERIKRSLKKLRVPTHQDLQDLSKKTDALSESIKELTGTKIPRETTRMLPK